MTGGELVTQDTSAETYVHHVVDTCLKIYASLLLLVGISGNVISGIIMGGNKANRATTRLLMIILSVADTAVLLVAVLRYWTIRVIAWDPRLTNFVVCKTHMFAVAFTTDYAVGALCAIAVERLLVVAFPHKANVVVSVKSVIWGMSGFGLVIVVKNLLHFWMMGYPESPSKEPRCVPLEEFAYLFKIFSKIDLISFAVLPYIILFSSNVYIYMKVRSQRALLNRSKPKRTKVCDKTPSASKSINNKSVDAIKNPVLSVEPVKRTKRRPDGVIKLLTALTVIHVCCTLPGTVFTFVTTYSDKFSTSLDPETQDLIKSGLVLLIFTNNATNIFGYYVSCSSFRQGFREMFKCFYNVRQSSGSSGLERPTIV